MHAFVKLRIAQLLEVLHPGSRTCCWPCKPGDTFEAADNETRDDESGSLVNHKFRAYFIFRSSHWIVSVKFSS